MTPELYENLKEEIGAAITEGVFNTRYAAVEMHHNIGKTIREFSKDQAITELLQRLAVDLGTSERTLFRSVELFDRYPDLAQLPDGKNVSMNKLLGSGKEKEEESFNADTVAHRLVTRYGPDRSELLADTILELLDEAARPIEAYGG